MFQNSRPGHTNNNELYPLKVDVGNYVKHREDLLSWRFER